jgi:glycosyltransferase involved in cell wall biosynthesis
MTAREAMAHGRPVVATRVGGLADLGEAVRLVEPSELGGAVKGLLADATERARLGAAARAYAQEHFAPAAAGRRLSEVYEDALQARRSSSRGTSDSSDAK